ncbi:lytic murein transglycosylase B [Kerstersia similis]|uniref:lytic murein transglycosylase B n=1 Tax=Kerstersia similis TaxID=206505 RepID=UPI0039EF3518
MFATSRFPQLGFLAMMLAGCANTASSIASAPAASAAPPAFQAARITVDGVQPLPLPPAGTASATAASMSPAAPVPAPVPARPAALPPGAAPAPLPSFPSIPGGFSRDTASAFAQAAAASRQLPADWTTAAMDNAQYHAQVASLMAPTRGGKPVVRSWTTYRGRFVEPIRIRKGRAFMEQNQAALQRAEREYGVPGHVIAAIIGVETLYGEQTGSFRVLDALSTLAFAYPDASRPERAAMFQDQLADFLLWTYQSGLDPAAPRGSFAGAMGMPQFMPTSILKFAVDGDGDGRIDLQNNSTDAILSVANFLRQHGWVPGLPVFAPARLSPQAQALADGGLVPRQDWQALQLAGASLAPGASDQATWLQHPLGVIDLKDEARGVTEFRTGTPNFFALTQYNRSYFYATAVNDLAQALLRQP